KNLQIIFPEWIILKMKDDEDLSNKIPLLKPLQAIHSLLNPQKGDVFENLILNIIYYILSFKLLENQNCIWKEVWTFLKKSKFIANMKVYLIIASPISFIPAIQNKEEYDELHIEEELIANPWSHRLCLN